VTAPDVSVVAAVRDATELCELLDGIAGDADGPAVEVVIVHGPSLTDDVPTGVRSVVVEPGQMARARAHGVAAATGRAIAFLEPGDRLLPGALGAAVTALDAHPGHAFVYGRVQPRAAGPSAKVESQRSRVVHVDHYVELLRGNFVGPSCAVLFRRSALVEAGVPAADAGELGDYALYLRLSRRAPVHCLGLPVAESDRGIQVLSLAELTALRAQRRHLRSGTDAVAAYRAGLAALLSQVGIQAVDDVRAGVPDRRRSLGRAVRSARLLAGHPRGIPAFLGAELLPWVARRRPGSRRLQALTGRDSRVPGLRPAARIAEVVRHSLPPHAPVVVLGRVDPAIDLGDRDVRFVAPPDWLTLAADTTPFLLVPRTSAWELATLGAGDLHGWALAWSDETCSLYRSDERDTADRVLVAGYFSFEDAHATAGDLLVRDQVCAWLERCGRSYDVAHAAPFAGGVDWRMVDPGRYSHVVFACGPFSPDLPSWELLERFPDARTVGLNLSMLAPLQEWNPFDALIERDSSRTSRPDVAFGTTAPRVPVVGICLREHAPGTRTADAVIRRLVASAHLAAVPIDTRLDVMHGGTNSTGQRTAAEVESLISRMDVVVTTRLHGLVLALKNGVPVVAVDPGNEGFKIRRQAEAVGWPVVFGADEVDDEVLRAALEFCRTDEARTLAAECAARAVSAADQVRRSFVAALGHDRAGTGN
jgi:hypothetical protein